MTELEGVNADADVRPLVPGAANVVVDAPVAGVPLLAAPEEDAVDDATVVLDTRTGEVRAQLPAGQEAAALVGDNLAVASSRFRDVTTIVDLVTGNRTVLQAPRDEPTDRERIGLVADTARLDVSDSNCLRLSDGLHCAAGYVTTQLVSLPERGEPTARLWHDIGVPDGLGVEVGVWTWEAGREPQRMLAVPGGVVLVATTYDRPVLIGLTS